MHTERAHALVDKWMEDMSRGDLTMPIERIFPLAEVAQAHSFVENGHPFGRVLMKP